MSTCPLCATPGGEVLWESGQLRIVRVTGPDAVDHPGFLRVIWNEHVREMSDLPLAERFRLMSAVFQCEIALREVLNPRKINLASLGNQTPHLHWHIIARFEDDVHFPRPIWAGRVREQSASPRVEMVDEDLRKRLASLMAEALQDR